MRPPAKIKPWLSLPQLTEWVCAASADASLLRKRLVVWLMVLRPCYARQVATLLGVSVVSVWRWVSRYNRGGPQALQASRRGGRRRGHFDSRAQEASALTGLEPQALAGVSLPRFGGHADSSEHECDDEEEEAGVSQAL